MSIDEHSSPGALPRTERPDAPAYLTRHRARRSAQPAPDQAPEVEEDTSVPLYLRQFSPDPPLRSVGVSVA